MKIQAVTAILSGRIAQLATAALAMLVLCVGAATLSAQEREIPESFDSAGRVNYLTPLAAARLQLGPPEWPIIGSYSEARLYRRESGGYVVIVERTGGALERFELTDANVAAIRGQVNALPPQFSFRSQGRASTAFVRNQTLMGFGIYAPAFAVAVTNEPAGRVSSYLLAGGVTFFGATQLARQMEITPNMNSLSTHMGLRAAITGAGLLYALGAPDDGRAAGAFVGGIAGSAAGLLLGRGWSESEAAAATSVSDVFSLATHGITYIVRGDSDEGRLVTRGEAGVLSGVRIAGYIAGRAYGAHAEHNFTIGDGAMLWITGALGASAGSIAYAGRDVGKRTQATALTVGYLAGVAAGELLLVRRFDHSVTDASMIALGTGAGGLMGLGVARLIDDEGDTDARTMAFATVGGVAGLFLTHYLIVPPLDASSVGSGFTLNPTGLALAAAGVPGRYTLFSLNFR